MSATWSFFRARRTTVTSNLEPSRLPVDPIQFPRTTIAGCKGRPLASGGVLSFSQIQYPSKNPISGNIPTPASRSGMQPAVSTLSPKISRAKALVRFSRYKAAQEAAPGTKLDLNRLKLRRRGRLAHLSQLAGSANREAAPELHRGQKVCTTGAMF